MALSISTHLAHMDRSAASAPAFQSTSINGHAAPIPGCILDSIDTAPGQRSKKSARASNRIGKSSCPRYLRAPLTNIAQSATARPFTLAVRNCLQRSVAR
jgi:hypothetical protein